MVKSADLILLEFGSDQVRKNPATLAQDDHDQSTLFSDHNHLIVGFAQTNFQNKQQYKPCLLLNGRWGLKKRLDS